MAALQTRVQTLCILHRRPYRIGNSVAVPYDAIAAERATVAQLAIVAPILAVEGHRLKIEINV